VNLVVSVPATAGDRRRVQADEMVRLLDAAGFAIARTPGPVGGGHDPDGFELLLPGQPSPAHLPFDPPETLVERALRCIPLDFDSLPIVVEGESKQVRRWTSGAVATRFKPTVYSYTANRYGRAPGTDDLRVHFTAAVFSQLRAADVGDAVRPQAAYLAEVPWQGSWLLVERLMETCNLEVRVKRYHIGSPLHRYRQTERHRSTLTSGPVTRWTRFPEPVVCFDWRHPLTDDDGTRLADEPLPDDYARLWMVDVDHAKAVARGTFLWLERLFRDRGVVLVDICLLLDRSGTTLYGEISPDCMRVSLEPTDPTAADRAAKDIWRAGGSPDELRRNYAEIYARIFGEPAYQT
jgi:phosphoribosylaminoimidazole-succinocarboxamide synthase